MTNHSNIAAIYRPFASKLVLMVVLAAGLLPMVSFSQSTVVYDSLNGTQLGGFSQPNSENPIFGDTLTLSHGGRLKRLGLSIFNPTSGGNTGSIIKEAVEVNFYDNTVAYTGGAITNPLPRNRQF